LCCERRCRLHLQANIIEKKLCWTKKKNIKSINNEKFPISNQLIFQEHKKWHHYVYNNQKKKAGIEIKINFTNNNSNKESNSVALKCFSFTQREDEQIPEKIEVFLNSKKNISYDYHYYCYSYLLYGPSIFSIFNCYWYILLENR
jgi:hypothetical protein